MIGILIVAHDRLGESLVEAVTHVLGARPPQFDVFPVAAADDPLALLPKARDAVAALDTGEASRSSPTSTARHRAIWRQSSRARDMSK